MSRHYGLATFNRRNASGQQTTKKENGDFRVILDEQGIDDLIAEAESNIELDSVISTGALAERVCNRRRIDGAVLPWQNLEGKFDLRPGELTVWAGDNGSGKSLLLGQIMSWQITKNQNVFIASMEMKPEETVWRMATQCAGSSCPPDEWIRSWCTWADKKLYIYDVLDTVATDRIQKVIRAVVKKFEVAHVVIDSLVKCGVAQDGDGAMTKQTHFVDSLQHLAKHLGTHIHLIAHTRKPDRNSTRITKYDIRGASQITDLVDNVCLVERNRSKEDAKKILPEERDDRDRALLEEPDTRLIVAKQRHFAWEGTAPLDYHDDSMQFIPFRNQSAMVWPDGQYDEPWKKKEYFVRVEDDLPW